MKDHVLVDERGVPLSVVVTAANVNDHIALPELLNNHVVVRPRPTCAEPQHICLDAAFDNEPTRQTLRRKYYAPHIAPKGGTARGRAATSWRPSSPMGCGENARLVRPLSPSGCQLEKTTESRYVFLCLASALIACRI
jgi:hypothetical protein